MVASAQPLLGDKRSTLPGRMRACLRLWWATTTSPAYLASRTSRRQLWFLGSIAAAITVLLDLFYIFSGSLSLTPGLIFSDAALVAIGCCVTHLPRDTLKSDVVLVATFVFFSSTYLWAMSDSGSVAAPASALCVEVDVFMLHAAGIHPCFVLAYSICMLPSLFSIVQLDLVTKLQTAFFVVVMVIFMSGTESLLASYFADTEKQLSAMRQLLDKAVDGYCTVDRSSGVVASASVGALEMLGRDLVGVQLLSFVRPGDRQRVQELISEGPARDEHRILATLVRRGVLGMEEFEVRAVSYWATDDELHITLQTIGEARMVTGEAPPTNDSIPPRAMRSMPPRADEDMNPSVDEALLLPPGLFHEALPLPEVSAEAVDRLQVDTSPEAEGQPEAGRRAGGAGNVRWCNAEWTLDATGDETLWADELWIDFETDSEMYDVNDLSRELLPGWLAWVQPSLRSGIDRWVRLEVTNAMAGEETRGPVLDLPLCTATATWVAEEARVEVHPPDGDDLPGATLHLSRVRGRPRWELQEHSRRPREVGDNSSIAFGESSSQP